MVNEGDYLKFRGNCKELAEAEVKKDSSLTLTRGYYYCPIWGKQEHWWCTHSDGSIVDPSVKQFPSGGYATDNFYEEFDGICDCAECGKEVLEENAIFHGRYAFCSTRCALRFVGL